MTVQPEDSTVEIQFLEGMFALPAHEPALNQRRRQGRSSTPVTSPDTTSTTSPSVDGTDASELDELSEDEEDEESSAWSGTQKAGSRARPHVDRGESVIIAGGEDDLPPEEVAKGDVAVVGGTVVVRGVRSIEERRALERVFRVLVSPTLNDRHRRTDMDTAVHDPVHVARARHPRRLSNTS
jgi:1-phosphatidylinositol-3-phosphate 5-kinase